MSKKYLFIDMEIIPGVDENKLVSFGIIDEIGREFYAELKFDPKELLPSEMKYYMEQLDDILTMKQYSDRVTIYDIKSVGDNIEDEITTDSVTGDLYYVRAKLEDFLEEYKNDTIQWISKLGHYDIPTWRKFLTDDQTRISFCHKNVMDLHKKLVSDPNGITLAGYKPSFGIVVEPISELKEYDEPYRLQTNKNYKNNCPRSHALTKARQFRDEYLNSQK